MKRIIYSFAYLIIFVGFIVTDTFALPYIYSVNKDKSLYGYLDQHKLKLAELRDIACGPAATVNSFVYLQNKYPKIYGTKLVPDTNNNNKIDEDEMVAIAEKLARSDYMNTNYTIGGTYTDMLIYGKWKYIKDVAPGSTTFHAQSRYKWIHPKRDNEKIPKPSWVKDKTIPTWEFIYNELSRCEDIEIFIECTENHKFDHYVTLTGFYWEDDDNDKIIDPDEKAWIDYIDPWTGKWGNQKSGTIKIHTAAILKRTSGKTSF